MTLPLLWRRYQQELRVQRNVSERTIQAYQDGWSSLRRTAQAMGWRLRSPDDVTFERLMEWQSMLKEVGRKEWTCRTYLMSIKGFSKWLHANGHARSDVGARFRSPRLRRVLPVLPPFETVVARLEAEPDVRNRTIIAVALFAGLRAQEIADLRVLNYVPGSGLVGFVGKGQKQRSVALPRQALSLLGAYLAESPPKLPSDPLIRKRDGTDGKMTYQTIHDVITRWSKRHLGAKLSPHKLRHIYGKHCVDLGVDVRVIAESLGHESLESTRIYTQVSFERVRHIAELIEGGTHQLIQARNTSRIKQFSEA
jgi:site-specific recombinase XerD